MVSDRWRWVKEGLDREWQDERKQGRGVCCVFMRVGVACLRLRGLWQFRGAAAGGVNVTVENGDR